MSPPSTTRFSPGSSDELALADVRLDAYHRAPAGGAVEQPDGREQPKRRCGSDHQFACVDATLVRRDVVTNRAELA